MRYYSRVRVAVILLAPLIILIWYLKNKHRLSEPGAGTWEELRRTRFLFNMPFDLTQETFIVRLAQLLSILVGI